MARSGDADAEEWVLTTDEGIALLAEVGRIATPRPGDLIRWRKSASPENVAAAVRLVEARRRGAVKFARADRMWFETTGLEQATAESVARHKATRFAGRAEVVLDLCCGIGGDTIALAAAGCRVMAVDRDEGMCRRSLWNARVYDVAERVAAVRSSAETVVVQHHPWIHIDPDRRAKGREAGRARLVSGYQPGPAFLRGLTDRAPGGAIKLGPASDFATHFGGSSYEVELISLKGECKEATVWFGEARTCSRRATRLPEGATWTDRDAPPGFAPTGPVGAYVFDPDPSLGRSGLLDGFAIAHGLARVSEGIDYLTGPRPVLSTFLANFVVIELLPLDLKSLKREVRTRGLGLLEVKTRGLDLRPEDVRAFLKPAGDRPVSLLLCGGTGRGRAILAERVN